MLPRKLWKVLFRRKKKNPVQFLRFIWHFFPQNKRIIKRNKNKVLSYSAKGNSDGITSRDADRGNFGMGSWENLLGGKDDSIPLLGYYLRLSSTPANNMK